MAKKDNVAVLNRPNGAANATKRGDTIQQLMEASEAEQAKIDAIMAEARKKCQPHRDEMKALATAAAEEGTPKKVFNAGLRYRSCLFKAASIPDSLNEEQREDYVIMFDELEDFMSTPLGALMNDDSANDN